MPLSYDSSYLTHEYNIGPMRSPRANIAFMNQKWRDLR